MTLKFIGWVDFKEKEFEHAANRELERGSRTPAVYPSNQGNEKVLGYDAVANPSAKNLIWTLLRLTRPPGVILKPTDWQHPDRVNSDSLPPGFCSLVMQYKRPQFVSSATRSPQRRLWPGQDYYRIQVSRGQHLILEHLERQLDSNVHVRYCAPAFGTYALLRDAETRGNVLRGSTLVSPRAPDATQHKYWTYALSGLEGQWNADGVEAHAETVEGFLGNDNYLGEPLSLHLSSIARGLVASGLLNADDLSYWIDEVDQSLVGFREFGQLTGVPYSPRSQRGARPATRWSRSRYEAIAAERAGLSVAMDVLLVSIAERAFRRFGLDWFLVPRY